MYIFQLQLLLTLRHSNAKISKFGKHLNEMRVHVLLHYMHWKKFTKGIILKPKLSRISKSDILIIYNVPC